VWQVWQSINQIRVLNIEGDFFFFFTYVIQRCFISATPSCG
jgi:hypothetical protein